MNAHASCQLSAAMALTQLLLDYPEIQVLTWTIDPLGTLRGEQHALDGHGQIVDLCAEMIDATAVHTVLDRSGDRLGLAQLATVWQGVPVDIWATYPASVLVGTGGAG